MKKYLFTIAHWPQYHPKLNTFEQYLRPRFQEYSSMHDLKYIELNSSNFTPQILHPEYEYGENFHYNRWSIFNQLLDSGRLQDGDIIYQYDADVWIAKTNEFFIPEKQFTYAIDSGNTHCMGFYILKIGDFTRKIIKNMLSRERFLKLKDYHFFNEHNNTKGPWIISDQQCYYCMAGIKPHSWTPFYDLPNYGFHSYPTEYTLFSVDELLENVQILPTEWNVTHLVEETGDNGKPCTYDIVRTTKEKVINRHFAGGQPWRCAEWKEYCK